MQHHLCPFSQEVKISQNGPACQGVKGFKVGNDSQVYQVDRMLAKRMHRLVIVVRVKNKEQSRTSKQADWL